MQGLKQTIASQECFKASLLLAQYFQKNCLPIEHYQQKLNAWAKQARQFIITSQLDKSALTQFIRFFYVELAFSADEHHFFAKQNSLMNKVMDFRTGIPMSLAIVFQALAEQLGFAIYGINFPGHFLLRADFSDSESIYLDPNNGNVLSYADLEALYFRILGEIEQEKMPPEALLAASCEESIVRLLHNLKAAYINSQDFQLALIAVELLVELCPNDPYERRDRGFLLHQLDCMQVAIADYQYFIRQCPHDPASPLLAAQLKHLVAQPSAIFH
ncbi:tetratricopeptide repeat protein [Paraglaciecola sp.]|uniref:SirB1 family protein n=1 Tax=Paraglaciecola sp. TaxID=1920173 RepID=UPI0030F413E6